MRCASFVVLLLFQWSKADRESTHHRVLATASTHQIVDDAPHDMTAPVSVHPPPVDNVAKAEAPQCGSSLKRATSALEYLEVQAKNTPAVQLLPMIVLVVLSLLLVGICLSRPSRGGVDEIAHNLVVKPGGDVSAASGRTDEDGSDSSDSDSDRYALVPIDDALGCASTVVGADFSIQSEAGDVVDFFKSNPVVPNDSEHLEQLLRSHGIDISKWGKTLGQLQGQLLKKQCWLMEAGAGPPEKPILVRAVRVLVVNIAAVFPTGLRVLRCVGVRDKGTGEFKKKMQNCARKLRVEDIVDDELGSLLLHELRLPVDWQQKHLQVHCRRAIKADSQGGERGTSFPGLSSEYLQELVWMKLDDVNAYDSAGKLMLPSGQGKFEIEDTAVFHGKVRFWEWTEVAEEERNMWSRSLGTMSS